jgi:hypothetical protein
VKDIGRLFSAQIYKIEIGHCIFWLTILIKDPQKNISAKSGCSFFGKEVKHVFSNKKPGRPSCISNRSKNYAHQLM